jgi:hypothetical protein
LFLPLIDLAFGASLLRINLCVVPQSLFLNDGARARVAGGIWPIVARVGSGLAVRNGVSRPDSALKRTLLAAAAKKLRGNRPSADRLPRRSRSAFGPHPP